MALVPYRNLPHPYRRPAAGIFGLGYKAYRAYRSANSELAEARDRARRREHWRRERELFNTEVRRKFPRARKLVPAKRNQSVPKGKGPEPPRTMVKSKYSKFGRRKKSAPKRKMFRSMAKTKRSKPFTKRATLKYKKGGATFSTVSGGTLSLSLAGATDRRIPLIVGHVTCTYARFFLLGCRGIVKLMAQKMDNDFRTWDEVPNITRIGGALEFVACIAYNYSVVSDGATLEHAVILATGDTWNDVAVKLADSFKNFINDGGETFIVNKIWWQWQNGADPLKSTLSQRIEPDCLMNANDIMLSFEHTSMLSLQNRTPGATSGVEVESNRNDIAANPLRGKVYNMNKGYAALKAQIADESRSFAILQADTQSGAIFGDLTIAGVGASVIRQYTALPNAAAFRGVTSCSNVIMPPGDVKRSYVSYSKKMSMNYFLKSLHRLIRGVIDATSVTAVAVEQDFQFANGKFYLLKKSLHDGTDDDPKPAIAYQITNKDYVKATHKRKSFTTNFQETVS